MVSITIYVLSATVGVLFGIRKFRERFWGFCKNRVQLDNKVIVITGANCGIGYETAKELANRNAEVVLACRNVEAAQKAVARIERDLKKNVKMTVIPLDLASLRSIEEFAKEVNHRYPRIDILINNAGVAYPKNTLHQTSDGFEVHFGVNHLGHFYLTKLLQDSLQNAEHSRVVIVSSTLHEQGTINVENLKSLSKGNGKLYANSKLANVYFCREFSKRFPNRGINVYALCPGWVYTSLFRHSFKWYHYIMVAPIAFFYMKTPWQGAQTTIYCATEPALDAENGLLYRDCRHYNSKVKFDDTVASKLWDETARLIEEKNLST